MQVTSLNQNLVSPIISMQNANRPLYLLKESLHKAAAMKVASEWVKLHVSPEHELKEKGEEQ